MEDHGYHGVTKVFLEWLMSSISTLSGMLSSNSCYGTYTKPPIIAVCILEKFTKFAFPEINCINEIKNNLDCFKYVIASHISLRRCRLTEGKSLL